MNYTDICTLDAQGRIVIPTKMRKSLNLVNQDSLEAELSGQEIHLRKCGELSFDVRRISTLLTILYNNSRHPVVLCSDTQVISAVGRFLPDGTPVSRELSERILAGEEYFTDKEKPFGSPLCPGVPVAALFPIHAPKPLALAVLSSKPLSEVTLRCAKVVAAAIEQEFM
ncbi:hypothetical protein AALD74_12150 [Lachnospiraceae bacterium 48-21]